ncbi:putative drug exporter of the RND superfamily [Thermoleophilum album]|uniref:Putative drug exporter of the RND superfamily n=1 Tax=Thermoleophilum album TaxID=29539 RepID=A0A1H6FZV3_THEAL|nr:putative drug exporter of the RND superfamily [Thermoleophilum album]
MRKTVNLAAHVSGIAPSGSAARTPPRRSIFALACGRRSRVVCALLWLVVVGIAAGPLNLPKRFTDAEDNEATSFLPGDAEATRALALTRRLQGGELAPAVIVYRRERGLTASDLAKIRRDVRLMARKRFATVVADGPAVAGGKRAGQATAGLGSRAPVGLRPGCGLPGVAVPGQPRDYRPFVGPLCSPDGKAAIITAYLRGNGKTEGLLEPVDYWRRVLERQPPGLVAKLTGGAGFSADAIKVFEGINGRLLGAALTLVILLLIAIYRSPIFLFLPLAAVLAAEVLSRSLGWVVSELGVTVNGQSSSIMSVLVLGAGTDYALLIVARYREELHRTDSKFDAARNAMVSAGPAVLASAATVVAGLFCLRLAKVNGTSGLGPFGALGVASAALSMLTLLPALLVIAGRRAFWPFVPHTPTTAPRLEEVPRWSRRHIVEGSRFVALTIALAAVALVALLLPLVLVGALVRRISGKRLPSPVSLLDRVVFRPYELRRQRHERLADATHGAFRRIGEFVLRRPRAVLAASVLVLALMAAGLLNLSTDLTTRDSYRKKVDSVVGQELLERSFPSGASAPADVIVSRPDRVAAVRAALARAPGVAAVQGPVASGREGVLLQATLVPDPYSTAAYELVGKLREVVRKADPGVLVGGPSAIERDVREAAARDTVVIPPVVLVVVLLILIVLLRALLAPLLLVATVLLSFAAALGVSYVVFDVVFGFPGSDPALPLYAFVFLVALGVDYNIFLAARAREETREFGTREGMLRALAVTGGVITSAGIVLAGTFTVLGVLPLVFLTEIGFTVAFGVLLDTFLVRTVLVPALAFWLGERFWWPARVRRDATVREPLPVA